MRACIATITLLSALSAASPRATIEAQGHRRLQSRSAFAALDAASLADSAALRPMDAAQKHDATMLAMAAYLDSTVGRTLGVSATPIRWWHGFGTQAHPTQGILVDDGELAGLSAELLRQKGLAGVPLDMASPRALHALRFVVAHEYGHLLQYRVLPADSIGSSGLTRVVECSADLLGGMMFRRYMRQASFDDSTREVGRLTASHFGSVIGSPDWLDATAHPTPRLRQRCIDVGMENATALSLALQGGSPRDSAERAYAQRMRRDAPGLSPDVRSVVRWSFEKARQLVGPVVPDAHWDATNLSVVRDTTVPAAVARLSRAALRGASAITALKGAHAPGTTSTFVLTESLPTPWQCILGNVDSAPAGVCAVEGHDNDEGARDTYNATVIAVRDGLAATDWTMDAKTDTTSFAVRGKGSLQGRSARITVVLDQQQRPSDMMAQQPPRFGVTITFSAQR